MSEGSSKLLSFFAVAIMLSAGIIGLVSCGSEDSFAAGDGTQNSPFDVLNAPALGPSDGDVFYVYEGASVSIARVNGIGINSITPSSSSLSLSSAGGNVTGTMPVGTYVLQTNNGKSFTLIGVPVGVDYYAILKFDANGGSNAPAQQSASIVATSPSGSKTFTIPNTVPTKQYYAFKGWSTQANATSAAYQPGQTVSVSYDSTVTLYAVWEEIVPVITSSPSATNGIVGNTWTYNVTNELSSGVSYSVSGASWLTVNGSKILGTPTAAGTYNVTVTATYGTSTDSQTFSILIVDALSFESVPTGSILVNPA